MAFNSTYCGFLIVAMLACLHNVQHADAKVLELNDRFLEVKQEGMWLVMFYAPWCGHCKKLEPVWHQVEQAIAGKLPVRVGKIDSTRFSNVATEFSIRGFPTVLFFKGDLTFSYEGDRTLQDIVGFVNRLVGPAVKEISTKSEFDAAKTRSDVFFMFSGETNGALWDNFKNVAEIFQQHEFFYQAKSDLAEQFSGTKEDESQSIRVYKDGSSYKYDNEDSIPEIKDDEDDAHSEVFDATALALKNVSLITWMMAERFPKFVQITRGRFGQLLSTRKLLVMCVLEVDKLGKLTSGDMEPFRSMIEAVVDTHIDKYRTNFQFGWTGSDLANSVAMSSLSLPHLIVVNTTTYQHYLPDEDPSQMTPEAVTNFLDAILEGSAPVYGGSSYTMRLYRAYFEAKTNLFEMWRGNPMLTSVLFGLPMGFFALICYTICCADIMEEGADEDGEGEDNGQEGQAVKDQDHEKTD